MVLAKPPAQLWAEGKAAVICLPNSLISCSTSSAVAGARYAAYGNLPRERGMPAFDDLAWRRSSDRDHADRPASTMDDTSAAARELAVWIGLVPRQHTTGGKPKLGSIGSQADHYLHRQMIHGARSVSLGATTSCSTHMPNSAA